MQLRGVDNGLPGLQHPSHVTHSRNILVGAATKQLKLTRLRGGCNSSVAPNAFSRSRYLTLLGGRSTRKRRPSFFKRRCASSQDGGSVAFCTQWVMAASSHHFASRGMTLRCAPERINERIPASSIHTERVQKT